MASRATNERWLSELTNLPTASGLEQNVVSWVSRWVDRRPDLRRETDGGGNLLITQKGRKSFPYVVAVAHMDHPAFVVTAVDGRDVHFEFRGGVDPEYFEGARVNFVTGTSGRSGTVVGYDAEDQIGTIRANKPGVQSGDIAMWRFPAKRAKPDRHLAPACDDLAGCAGALAALDRARKKPELRHFAVLLTRAEEVGLVGATHAARTETLAKDARVLSIETSRTLPNAPIGEGPIIRVGDAATIFDHVLTNRISTAARAAGIRHQRKLMDGGGCEATAFGAYGYQTSGICLALGNWHNRGNLDAFEAGTGEAVPMMEEISLGDFHGLVDLLLTAIRAADQETKLEQRFESLYESTSHILKQEPAG